MSNLLPVVDDVNDGLQGGHGKHYKMEQDGRLILDLRTGKPAVFDLAEVHRRKAVGDYTDIPADAPADEAPAERKTAPRGRRK